MRKKTGPVCCMAILAILLCAAFLACVCIGAAKLTPADILRVFQGKGKVSHANILFHVRIPRVAACALAGAGLSVSGVLIQNVFRNPLAGPNIIGVNAGAGLAVVICSALFPLNYRAVPPAAFLGALITTLLLFLLAKRTGASRITLVLAGVCINSLLTAVSDTIHTLSEDTLASTYSFRLGGFQSVTVQVLIPAGILILAAILVSGLFGNELEVLSLGEDVAESVGLNTSRWQFVFLILAAVLAGASVSFAGLLGFVGLIVPHISRKLVGEECRFLIPFSAMFGAFFVMLCDLAARSLFAPHELPTGIILSFVGAPFFLHLLFSGKRRRSHD